MKKIMTAIVAKVKSTVENVRAQGSGAMRGQVRLKLAEERGQIFMEHTVGFIIVIVIGGIAIVLLTSLLRNDMAPALTTKIMSLFN